MNAKERTALVERARRGNAESLDQLLAACYPRLLSFARALLGNPEDAEDAAQEASLVVWTRVQQLKNSDAFGSWSNMVVRRTCLRILERRRRYSERHRRFDETSHEFTNAGEAGHPESLIELRQILDHVGDPMTDVLCLRLVIGLSVRETAACLGLSEGAVKARLFRARHKALQHV